MATESTSAAVVAPRDLYEGEVVVQQQNPADRDALLSEALGQVLIRVTGNRQILSQQPAQDLQKDAVRYVQQFGYERRPAPAGKPSVPVLPPATSPAAPTTLQVFIARFDASALNAQLRVNGLPVWGRERPTTLVWLAVQGNGNSWLVNSDTAATEAPALIETAKARGLPLQLPNPPGVNTPDALDIMQGVTERLLTISRSYGVSRVLVARITQVVPQWNGSWTLIEDNQPQQTWQITGTTLDEVIANGMHQIADQYAARYAVLSSPGTSVTRSSMRLQVTGIQGINDYARVSKYLASLSAVSASTLVEVTSYGATYQLTVQGDRTSLRQAISLGNTLEVDTSVQPGEDISAPDSSFIKYRLKTDKP